jgi:hypothetical protein
MNVSIEDYMWFWVFVFSDIEAPLQYFICKELLVAHEDHIGLLKNHFHLNPSNKDLGFTI